MNIEKQKVSTEMFEKKVEVEAAYLIHQNNMSKVKADKVAREVVAERFEVE